jgi:deoxyribodipyrimidine photo-lyase
MSGKVNFFWFRRDLRFHDNKGLYHALKEGTPVVPVFIFDTEILNDLDDRRDARVDFLHSEVSKMKDNLKERGSDMVVKYGEPTEVWADLLEEYSAGSIYYNRDYETYAKERDRRVREIASQYEVEVRDYKDHVIFEKEEVQKNAGGTYTVFTPFKNKWYSTHQDALKEGGKDISSSKYFKPFPSSDYQENFLEFSAPAMISLENMGFEKSNIEIPSREVSQKVIKQYGEKRNFPAQDGTSRLGIHYRFGTISIRDKAKKAFALNKTYLNELIWRDFYSQILDEFPHVVDGPFREKYSMIPWRNDEEEFQRWCEGKTGYPIVDAGMRELNTTGYMHNRVRMITASFLTKHLLIDWRWGESYFAKKLLDYELASNNGGWQWAAGTGTDAAPYFRIFNPYTQVKKFDKDEKYLDEWVPERNSDDYPEPIVDHKAARERCLNAYKNGIEAFEE